MVCVLVSIVGWIPLSLPSRMLNGIMGDLALWQVCTAKQPGSLTMFVCGAGVGVATVVVGPLLTAFVLYLFRKQLSSAIQAVLAGISSLRHLTAPIVATAVFLVAWAGTHFNTWAGMGLLPNILFPGVVGLFTHWSTRNAAAIQHRFSGALERRDRFSKKVRLVGTMVVTTLFAIILSSVFADFEARVMFPTVQQQIVVLVGLVVGYAAMVPRTGDPLQDARRLGQKMGMGT